MICPVCSSELARTKYEGLPVFSCVGCSGYLVASRRVTDIQRRRQKSADELAEETLDAGSSDNSLVIRCPQCKRKMEKTTKPNHRSFQIDRCSSCDLVWFDPGELARSQLDYEFSDQGAEAARFQDRHQNMTDSDKQAFEENLSKLPEGDASLASAFGRGLLESLDWCFDELQRRR